jgi:3',5'-cyclic-AMP phosphodiesterase
MNDFDKPVVVVLPGDLHLTEPRLENVQAAHRVVDDVNILIRPNFVQFVGDNVQDATEEQFELFNQIRARLDVPHFALIGDHDIKNDPDAVGFRRHVGEPYGAMTLHGFRFIRLNTQESRPVGLSTEQIGWFRNELERADARGERIVIFQHNYPYQIWEDFVGPGIDDWRGLVQTHRIEAIICGHTHYWQMANDGRNALLAVRSIGDPEGGAPGYAVLYCRGDDLAVTYRSVDDRGPIVVVTHPRERLLATGSRHIVTGSDRVVVRVWSVPRVCVVRYSIDGGPWSGLELADDGHWRGRLPGDRLTKGAHSLEVVAVTADGTEGSQRIDFMVDPTGRYTAVPKVKPAVNATDFC